MLNENTMQAKYWVNQSRLGQLQAEIAKLNKRAIKLGVPEILLMLTGNHNDIEVKNGDNIVTHVNRFTEVLLTGETPKLAGWSLAAVVEHAEEGNILRKTPACKIELNKYRTGAPYCDHCKKIRNRRDTYILAHDDGKTASVGSNCIRDFLGGLDPHTLAKWSELLFSATELCEAEDGEDYAGGGGTPLVRVDAMLAFSACAIRRLGFVSGKTAREIGERGGDASSTAHTAAYWMNPSTKAVKGKDYFTPDAEDIALATLAQSHVLDTLGAKDPETLSDFEHNLLLVCKCSAIEPRNIGLLAFVPEFYARSIADKHAAANETHFGEVGKRVKNVPVTYLKSTGFETQYGYMYIHTFVAGDAKLIWKTSSDAAGSPGRQMLATFTVKGHGDYKGHKQTTVSRMVFAGE